MEDFVTFEIAKKLKEKGFREKCLCHYVGDDLIYNIESPIANDQLWFSHNKHDNIWHRDNVDAPTISQVLKWLREENKIFVEISPEYIDIAFYVSVYKCKDGKFLRCYISDLKYNSYEEAALAGIEYTLDKLI